MRRLLQGDALAFFNQSAVKRVNETNENFYLTGNDLIMHMLPIRALSEQKCYMRRHLRKPRDVKVRDFMTRLVELNHYLDTFPPFLADQMLPDDKIMDIAEYAVPAKWQRTMRLHGFKPVMHTDTEFMEFCEQIEFTEVATNNSFTQWLQQQRQLPFADILNGQFPVPVRTNFNQAYDWKRKPENRDRFCVLHQCRTHDTSECKVLLDQAKKMWSNFENHRQSYAKTFKKPLGEFKKVTQEEHNDISWLV